MADIFGIEESGRFASAIAKQDGIRVKTTQDSSMPFTDTRGNIRIGVPSIYNHEEYMGSLHGEISKQVEEVSFFRSITDLEEGSLQDVCKDIIQTEVTEKHRHGVFEGRDSILANQYDKNLQKNGGLPQIIKALSEVNPTIGAVMYLNNEMRNKWQGYHHCTPSAEIQDELDRLGFLEEEWESLETEDDLRTLLHRIEFEEPPEEPPNEGDGDEDGEGDGNSDGQGSGSGNGEGSGDDSGEGSGSGADEEPKDGDDSEGSGSGEAEQGSEGKQGSEGSDPDSNEEGEDKAPNNPGIGAGAGAQKLKDMGLVKKPMVASDSYYEDDTSVPYTPDNNIHEYIVADMEYEESWAKTSAVRDTLGTFSLSRKIKRYLISMSQTGYEYGKKTGKLCSKNVARLYTGSARPTIFKQRQATKIQQDTAIFILGDCSGSMSGQKYLTSASAQIATSEVLQGLRIPHMMMQFTTSGQGILHYIMKGFEERFVSRDILLRRYGNGELRMGCNADGEAVTRAAQILARRPEKQKVLIVLSDGSPAHEYNSSQFLKDTVKSIEDSKVMSIIGIGIKDKNVRRFYSSCKIINRIEELEPVLLGLLKEKVLK